MNNRTAYILGKCLGKMIADLKIKDRTALLTNAMHNPMSQITILHMKRLPDFSEQLTEYLTAMMNQIDSNEALGDLTPEEKSVFSMGYQTGLCPFDVKTELRMRNITQQQLADFMDIGRSTLARWLSEEGSIPKDRRTEIELAIYSLSGTIGNGYEYITE